MHVLVFVWLDALAIADADLDRPNIVGAGLACPFVQNLLLACREEGLGATLATMLCMVESQVLAMLEAPEGQALAGFIAVGYPPPGFTGTPLKRRAVEDFAFSETFAQPFVALTS